MSKASAWNVQTCTTSTPPSTEKKLPEPWKQPESMEQCVGRLQPSDGVSREFGRAVEGALQRPTVQHTAQRLSRPGGTAAFQALTRHGYSTGHTLWEDVGNLVTNKDCSDDVQTRLTAPNLSMRCTILQVTCDFYFLDSLADVIG